MSNPNAKDIFKSDIEEMMFGFGDQWPPMGESTQLVQDIVVQYIEDLVVRAGEIGKLRGSLDTECFIYLVSRDRQKFSRVCKLLEAYEDLKSVQKKTIEDVQTT